MLRRYVLLAAVLGGVFAHAACATEEEVADELPGEEDQMSAALTIDPTTTAMRWKRWEVALQTARTYANPYADVTVDVTLTAPDGVTTRRTQAFWDGGRTFRIRYMFPTTGTWTWRTKSSIPGDLGLHDHQGTVQVGAYAGQANPLYQKGYLKTTQRFLTYGDGTPFLWMGDTAWAAPIAANEPEWADYIRRRKALRFNVIQVHTGTAWVAGPADRNGNRPFTGNGATFQWNPAYWQAVERKVQAANDQGLIVFFTKVMEPGAGFPAANATEVARFSRLFAARFQGSFVVYSPTVDEEWSSMADVSGNALAAAASQQLITAHPRFHFEPASIFHGKRYIDFAGLQSGAGWTAGRALDARIASRQAIEWPENLYARNTKPVLQLEVTYDNKSMQEGTAPGHYAPPYPPRMPRSAAWLSMLSGAKGITYGCTNVWSWGIPARWTGPAWTFDQAMNQPSATHMRVLFDVLSSINWASLAPRRGVVQGQSTDWLKKIALSIGAGGSLGVAYLPDNPSITLDMTAFSGTMRVTWVNPVTGDRDTTGTVRNLGVQTLRKPANLADAVLLLQRV